MISERVWKGVENAKAKRIRIGRIKTRDSDLIRKLCALKAEKKIEILHKSKRIVETSSSFSTFYILHFKKKKPHEKKNPHAALFCFI